MSFALTEPQILAAEKTVTRRLGWERLKVGDLVRPVRKCMGLKPGQKVEVIRAPIRIISVRRERLNLMTEDVDYGFREVCKEGFADHPTYRWPSEFVTFFCSTHRPCEPTWLITRIEFEYTSVSAGESRAPSDQRYIEWLIARGYTREQALAGIRAYGDLLRRLHPTVDVQA